MVNSDYKDYYNLALYLNTYNVNTDYMSFTDGVLMNGAMGSGLHLFKSGGEKVIEMFSKNKPSKFTKLRRQLEMRNAVKASKKWDMFKNAWRYNQIKDLSKQLPTSTVMSNAEFRQLTTAQQAQIRQQAFKARYFKRARKLLDEAKTLKGAAQAKKLKEFKQAFAEAKLAAYKAKFKGNLRPTTLLGKVKNTAQTVTGVRAANTAVKSLASTSKIIRNVGRFAKGHAAFAVLSVAADYEKFAAAKTAGGNKAMVKEIAKSSGVAAAEAVGFVAGMKAGAAIGTAVGTAVPVLGNIVGGIAGAVIGGFLSWGLGKLTHKALGCDVSEADKIGTKTAKLEALKAKYHSGARKRLVTQSAAAIAQTIKAEQEAKAKGQEVPELKNPVVKERYDKAVSSIDNILEDDPSLLEDLQSELDAAEQESQAQQVSQGDQNPDTAMAQGQTGQDEQQTSPLAATMLKFIERINDQGGNNTNFMPQDFQSPWALGNLV